MFRKLLRAKIHRATVTEANLDYEGSVTIPPELMVATDLLPNEAVWIWNVTSGTRFETYAISGRKGSCDICINGAAAHLARPGDLVIIAAFTILPEDRVRDFEPKVVFVDQHNRIKEIRPELLPSPDQLEFEALNR